MPLKAKFPSRQPRRHLGLQVEQARVQIHDHDVVRGQGDPPAVAQARRFDRVAPGDRLESRCLQIRLRPAGKAAGVAALIRGDDHEGEIARAWARRRWRRGPWRGRRARAGTRTRGWCRRDKGDVEGQVEAGRALARLGALGVSPCPRVAETPACLRVLVSVVALRTLEIAADLRYARHRMRGVRLAAG